ncbi:unnamed protein product, partial [Rotaria magnacalcarata]
IDRTTSPTAGKL